MSKAVFDYHKVDTVASQLDIAKTELVDRLAALQKTVAQLLTSGGGLWMDQSSPALHDAYVHFNASLTQAMQNIASFADRFRDVKNALANFDGDTHKAILKAEADSK